MTMLTEKLQCVCGYKGAIKMSGNDQPYSDPWERHELVNLYSNRSYYVEGGANWDTVFSKLSPCCPKCKKHFTKENLILEY